MSDARTVPMIPLNATTTIPQLGLGVFQVPPAQTVEAVLTALEAGYRHIDTASLYGNEAQVGDALKNSGVPREDVFVTTKVGNDDHGHERALAAFETSMERLQLDYLDLYLVHWPLQRGDYVETWRALEELQASGRVRAIGVSNFAKTHLRTVMDECDVVPAINQVELHPYLVQEDLRAFHAEHGIVTQAWSPIGAGKGLLDDPVITTTAQEHGVSPAQVVLRWHLQLGNVAIPKSVTRERIVANIDVLGFELSDDDVAAITGLERAERTGPDPDVFDG